MSTHLDVAFGRLAVARGMIAADVVRTAWRTLEGGRTLKDALVDGGHLSWAQAEALEAELRSMAARRGVEGELGGASDEGSGVFGQPISDSGPLPRQLSASGETARPAARAPDVRTSGSWDLSAGSGVWPSGGPPQPAVRPAPPAAPAPPPSSPPVPAPAPAPPSTDTGTLRVPPPATDTGTLRVPPPATDTGTLRVPPPATDTGTLRVPPPPPSTPSTPSTPARPAVDPTVAVAPPSHLLAAPPAAAGAGKLPQPGQVLAGRYRLVRVLGQGGMGAVFEAQDAQRNGAAVAIKVILPQADPQGALLARFRREAESLAKISHPGVVRIRDLGEDGGLPFAVMDLVRGQDLKGVMAAAGGALPLERALELMAAVALAVEACHQAGVLHRDLKPANVLVRAEDDAPLVSDFGLALDRDAERLTRTGELMGTPSYMPPEQAEGDKRLIGPRTDVYALGATLYELVTGRPPFEGTPVQVLKKVFSDLPLPPSQLPAGRQRGRLPAGLDAICLKALAKEPRLRYPTAAAFAADLLRLRHGDPISAQAPTRWELLGWRLRRRDPRALLVAAVPFLVLGLLISGAGLMWGRLRSQQMSYGAWSRLLEGLPLDEQLTAQAKDPPPADLADYTAQWLRGAREQRLAVALAGGPLQAGRDPLEEGLTDAQRRARADSRALACGLMNLGQGWSRAPRAFDAAQAVEGIAALLSARPAGLPDPVGLQRLQARLRVAHGLPWAPPAALPASDPELRLLGTLTGLGWRGSPGLPRAVGPEQVSAGRAELDGLAGSKAADAQGAAQAAKRALGYLEAEEQALAQLRAQLLQAIEALLAGGELRVPPAAHAGPFEALFAARLRHERRELLARMLRALAAARGRSPEARARAVGAAREALFPLVYAGEAPQGEGWLAEAEDPLVAAALQELVEGLAQEVDAGLNQATGDPAHMAACFGVFRGLSDLLRPGGAGPVEVRAREVMLKAILFSVVLRDQGRLLSVQDLMVYMRLGGAGVFGLHARKVLPRFQDRLDEWLAQHPGGDGALIRGELARTTQDAVTRAMVEDFGQALGPRLTASEREALGLDPWQAPPGLAVTLTPCWEGFARWKLARCLLAPPEQGGASEPARRAAALELLLGVVNGPQGDGAERFYPPGERCTLLSQTAVALLDEAARAGDPEGSRRAEAERVLRRLVAQAWRELEQLRAVNHKEPAQATLLEATTETTTLEQVVGRKVVPAVEDLAKLLEADRRLAEARTLVADAVARLPEQPSRHELTRRLAHIQRSAGDLPAADRTLRALVDALTPQVRGRHGDQEILRQLAKELDLACLGLAQLRLEQQDPEGARELLKLAVEDGVLDGQWDGFLPRLGTDRQALGNLPTRAAR